MTEISCPRCLTVGQAPAALERLACPVCSAVLCRSACPECGRTHVIEEAGTTTTCPVTGAELVIVNGVLAGRRPPPSRPATPIPPPPPGAALPVPYVEPSEAPTQAVPSSTPLPPPPEAPAPAGSSRRILLIALAAVVVIAAAVVAFVMLSGSDEEGGQTPEGLVISQMDADPAGAEKMCAAVHTFAADRVTLTQLLDTMTPQVQESLVRSMRSEGAELLPTGSEDWAFPEIRRGIITVWDQCQKRGLGG